MAACQPPAHLSPLAPAITLFLFPSHRPPPLPSMSHCSYIGRNRPLPLITSCPSRPRLRGPGIKRINGARVSLASPLRRSRSVVALPTEQRLH